MKKLETKIIKWLNKFLKKFNRQLTLNRGYYLIQQGHYHYKCSTCESNRIALPDFKYQRYTYELQNTAKVESQDVFLPDEESYEVYGWAIERRSSKYSGTWSNSKPHKIYSSREIALNSIVHLKESDDPYVRSYDYEYRIKPIYHVGSIQGMRNVLINKITKNKK